MQALGRQMHVERHRDPANDALLRVEPIVEFEFEAVAPDVERPVASAFSINVSCRTCRFWAGEHLDFVALVSFVRQPVRLWLEGQVGDMPFRGI